MAKRKKSEIKILKVIPSRIKEISPEEAEKETEGEPEESADSEEGTFSQFLAKSSPVSALGGALEESELMSQEVPEENIPRARGAGALSSEELAQLRERYQKTELGEEKARYEPQTVVRMASPERPIALNAGVSSRQQVESSEVARMRRESSARTERYEIKPVEEKKDAKRKYPWEA